MDEFLLHLYLEEIVFAILLLIVGYYCWQKYKEREEREKRLLEVAEEIKKQMKKEE